MIRDHLTGPMFECMQIDYFKMVIEPIDDLLYTQVQGLLLQLRSLPEIDLEAGSDQSNNSLVFKVYFELRDFVAVFFADYSAAEANAFKLTSYFKLFEQDIVEWVCESRINGEKWVEEATRLDDGSAVTAEAKHSSSLLDVLKMIAGVIDFFQGIAPSAWDVATLDLFATQIADCVTHLLSQYAEMLLQKLVDNNFYDDVGRFDISEQLCVTLNNLTTAMDKLESIKADLGVDEIEGRYQEEVASGHHMSKSTSPTSQLFDGARSAIKRAQQRLAKAIARSVSAEISTFLRAAIATVCHDDFVDEEAIGHGTEPVLYVWSYPLNARDDIARVATLLCGPVSSTCLLVC